MKKFLMSAVLMLMCISAWGQEDSLIPFDYTETNPQEFYKYEQNVLNCVDWLVNTPIGERPIDRQVISQFLLIWMQATPSVVLNFDPKLMEFAQNSQYMEEMMTIYVGGYMAGLLREKEAQGKLNQMTVIPKGTTKADRITAASSAIEASLEFYDINKGTIGRNRMLEKYKKMQKEGTLQDYIEANLLEIR